MPRRAEAPATPPGSAPAEREAPRATEALGCPIGDLFRVLGRAHMLDILHMFTREAPGAPRRFVDIQARLQLSPNTLSDRLKELVAAGLLTRTVFNEIPPRVEYRATAKALDLRPVFDSLQAWAGRHDLAPEPAAAPEPGHASA